MSGAVSLGSIFGLLLQYWWATGIVLLAAFGAGTYLFFNRRRAKKVQEVKKEVSAIIIDFNNVRSPVVNVPQADIREFATLKPKFINGKKVYLLKPTMQILVAKPSGNGEHEETYKQKETAKQG